MDKDKGALELDKVIGNLTLIQMKEAVKANEDLGVGQVYNKETRRKLYDDKRKRDQFKDQFFDGKKTAVDGISGEVLHRDPKAAQNKYGSSHYTKHTSDVDHIIPAKGGHERLKKNPFLSDQDVKEIINSGSNYRVTQTKFNRQKQDTSDFRIALDPAADHDLSARSQLLKEKTKAEMDFAKNSAVKTMNNMSNEFASGAANALEASAIPVMIEGVHNLYLVANGEKEFNEAAKDMGKLTAQIAVSGGSFQVVTTGLTNVLNNSTNELLQKVASSNQVGQIISVSLILIESVGRYVNGEIGGEEFFREIGEKGVGLVSGMAGAIIGQALIPIPYVGAFVGSMVISTACMGIYRAYEGIFDVLKSLDEHKEKLAKISSLASQALAEMERQREVLKDMIGEQFSKWDKQFNTGFEEIFKATLNNDVDGISHGLDRILNVFGESVQFKNFEEFDEFFMDENSILKF